VVALTGALWALEGSPRACVSMRFSTAFLLAMNPLPYVFYYRLTFPLHARELASCRRGVLTPWECRSFRAAPRDSSRRLFAGGRIGVQRPAVRSIMTLRHDRALHFPTTCA
jgi:hypothetical protein